MENTKDKVVSEIKKVIVGKDNVILKCLAGLLAGGHILLDDIPGVGKTTLALAFSKAMGLDFNRVQFTPDLVPSDITGFSMYNEKTREFEYKPGAVFCNFLLADEINRTSSKTQSALLEVMQEGSLTVDGNVYHVPNPFIVMATQNPVGTAGTQMLPEAQLDRFMIQLSMGYPDHAQQIKILKDREKIDPMSTIKQVIDKAKLIEMKKDVVNVFADDKILEYVADLTENSRDKVNFRLGLSPRGALAILAMAKSWAFLDGRDYVIPEDVIEVFPDVARHRLILSMKNQLAEVGKEDLINEIIIKTSKPELKNW